MTQIKTAIFIIVFVFFVALQIIAADVIPDKRFAQSLNGNWSFKYIPSLKAESDAEFYAPNFDVSGWKTIAVPSNWELQGFAEPFYALELKDGLGLYRRTFRVPQDWKDRRLFLRFEGVAFGFDAWLNGKKIGSSSASAYNPNTFEITDAIQPNAENILAVQVTTKPLGFEFDVNDDWALSGIYRDVTIFSLPENYVEDLTTQTKIAPDGKANLSISVKSSQSNGEIRGRLISPNGKKSGEFKISNQKDGSFDTTISVAEPKLWTAETPSLYRLEIELLSNGKSVQKIENRIGLREISIVDGVLKLNDRPIKMRGVNHHDIDPETGRAITEKQLRRDLELMKKGNVNFIRTSHYPPSERLIDLADELGFYVMDEISIGKGEENLEKPTHRENILARVAPTIIRDKNHASVIVWSIGNENPVTEVEIEAGKRAKELDPSRPICYPKIGSYFAQNYQRIPDFVDIYAPHYPTNAMLKDYVTKLKRPTIFTEYAHGLGLSTDRIQDQWEIMQATPQFAGGAIWHFMDQGILRRSPTAVNRAEPTNQVWLDEFRYYDTDGLNGADGMVYSDRTPQTDFWEMRKVYAPVQIKENSALVRSGEQKINLTIENRFDFRSLKGMKMAWVLKQNGAEIQKGILPLSTVSREKENLQIDVKIPMAAEKDVLVLEARCLDETGLPINERNVRLNFSESVNKNWLGDLPTAGAVNVKENGDEIQIIQQNWELIVSRSTGALTIRDRAGRVLVAGIYPHSSRKLSISEKTRTKNNAIWLAPTLAKIESPEIKVEQNGSAVRLSVSGRYPRPEVQEQSFVGGYRAEIAPNGMISFNYDYVPTNASGVLTEAGLSLLIPAKMTEFRWLGQGIYAGFPGKDRLNEFGLFHLNRDDLRFPGNRRETELALLTTATGEGIVIETEKSDISVDRIGDQTLLSQNAVISGVGNKGTMPETIIDSAKIKNISGKFTLVLLDKNWTPTLICLFGKPTAATEVFRPFYHSYDQ